MTGKTTGIVLGAIIAGSSAGAAPADHYSPADLAKVGEALKAKAAATGGASEALAKYNNHHTMLAYRTKDGPAEIHAQFADIFFIVRGKATLFTEGTLEGWKEESPGEIRGLKITGGKTTVLGPGDVVHIPAGTPHQLQLAPGDELLYFVLKVQEFE